MPLAPRTLGEGDVGLRPLRSVPQFTLLHSSRVVRKAHQHRLLEPGGDGGGGLFILPDLDDAAAHLPAALHALGRLHLPSPPRRQRHVTLLSNTLPDTRYSRTCSSRTPAAARHPLHPLPVMRHPRKAVPLCPSLSSQTRCPTHALPAAPLARILRHPRGAVPHSMRPPSAHPFLAVVLSSPWQVTLLSNTLRTPRRARTPDWRTSRATTGDPRAIALQTGLPLTRVSPALHSRRLLRASHRGRAARDHQKVSS